MTGWVQFADARVLRSGVDNNETVLGMLTVLRYPVDLLAIEKIASYGMPVGAEVFDTCIWIGRFVQAASDVRHRLIARQAVKVHLCNSVKAKDSNIRQALIDRFGPVGTKARPGALYGVKSHAWAALAVAVTAHDDHENYRLAA
ncbi:hypothetical protein [Hydrocarboniphaga effusa]|uniref:hypothetical protein n=1 Tax=Hydrocarboniphaga effusa TaxID=243629 RepID=UPI00398BCDB0